MKFETSNEMAAMLHTSRHCEFGIYNTRLRSCNHAPSKISATAFIWPNRYHHVTFRSRRGFEDDFTNRTFCSLQMIRWRLLLHQPHSAALIAYYELVAAVRLGSVLMDAKRVSMLPPIREPRRRCLPGKRSYLRVAESCCAANR